MPWKIYDHVDGQGHSSIEAWLDALADAKVRARIEAKLMSIRTAGDLVLPNMVTDTTESRIKEVVLNGKAGAFRAFLARGPGADELVLLGGGREKDTKYQTKGLHITPAQAEQRRAEVFADPVNRRRRHEFAEDDVE
jgi:hypothetical protein